MFPVSCFNHADMLRLKFDAITLVGVCLFNVVWSSDVGESPGWHSCAHAQQSGGGCTQQGLWIHVQVCRKM